MRNYTHIILVCQNLKKRKWKRQNSKMVLKAFAIDL